MLRLWNTARHLKAVQVYGRLRFRLSRPSPDLRVAPGFRAVTGEWVIPASRRVSMTGPTRICLLNVEQNLNECGWDNPQLPKLWRYNLHYFDDLCAEAASDRCVWHRALLARWVHENPPANGSGWEPYPTSLRIVNWCKWLLNGHQLSHECVQSMAVQARWLSKRLEWHLLGNHLFANAKALLFAGCVFDGAEAEHWRLTALKILRSEIPEQILADGGQFERSPMYHALALEDMLDLYNLARTFLAVSREWLPMIEAPIPSMRHWLSVMCHPDGEVSFFNDSAMGVHPSPRTLEGYAIRMGLAAPEPPRDGCTLLAQSGFVRMQHGAAVVIVDVGLVGPDYLPGHAHADTLSFELSLYGKRVIVNSGTSEYGVGAERSRQRGTAAHNTVTIDGQDSSEVWGGFRVARRAHPFGLRINEHGDRLSVECSHDGYTRLRGKPIHKRTWQLSRQTLKVVDSITGSGVAQSYWHWAPGLEVTPGVSIDLDASHRLSIDLKGGVWSSAVSTWHPEFGKIVSNVVSTVDFNAQHSSVCLTWI